MKRTLLPCVLWLMALLGLQAQSENDAIYVFRNDGQFNAFFDAQVDSITYSHYDADSIWHSDWQMQVVYTVDSIYCIPLAVIDSVAFETPETVLQQGVIEIKENLLANVISATDSTILFSSSIPYSLLPSVGKLVVTTEMSDIFPAGFAGEVVHVESTADGYLMRCVPASLEDIFETFYSVSVRPMEETRAGVVETGRCTIGPFTVLVPSQVLENLSHSVNLRDGYAIDVDSYFDMSLTTQLDVSSMVIVNKEHGTYISLNCIGNYNLWEKIAFSGALTYEKKFGKAFHSPPIPVCPFVSFYVEPGFFFKASVEGGTENEWTQHYRSVFHYEYSSRGEEVMKPINCLIPVNKTHSGETTINGSVAIGGYVESGFAIKDKDFANVHIGAELGVELESNAILYKDETNTCRESYETYDKLHGSGIFLNWYYGTVAEAEFLKYTATYELPWGQKGRIAQMAHVPTFTNVSITPDPTDGTKAKGSAMVIGGCFLPQSVGLLLVDDEGNEVEKVYHKDKHYMLSTTMEHTFTGLDSDKHYTLYPIVHAYGVEMLASPKDELKLGLCNDSNHVHAVDLGLSVKWACCNVGAEVPEEYGGYYAWGETEEKRDYTPLTYKYYLGDLDGDGDYFDSNEYQNIGSNISGTSYDVAHVKWGGSWRMPTLSEIQELYNKCSWEWTTVNGVSGQKVTGPNGNSIFLPVAGYRVGTEVYGRGSGCDYWSGTLDDEDYSSCAYYLLFYSDYHGWNYSGLRYFGHSVRPVTE